MAQVRLVPSRPFGRAVFPSMPRISKEPNRVGNLARATIRVSSFVALREARARCPVLRGMKAPYYIRRPAQAALYIGTVIG